MGGGDSTTCSTNTRSYSSKSQCSLSFGSIPPALDHPPKRLKRLLQPPNSKFVNTNINDLPDNVLADILSRLPCLRKTYRSVCKRWRYLILTDLYFRGRYILRRKQPPELTLINKRGETFPMVVTISEPPMTPSSPKLLSFLFERLMSVESLTREPVVVGASSGLVLCCATENYQRDYYIGNALSQRWVNLPPPSRVLHDVPVGFICEPYYSFIKKDNENVYHRRGKSIIPDDGSDELLVINHRYRCKVVRILPYEDTFEDERSSKFKLEIFSFQTWEWREAIISFPRRFSFGRINSDCHFFHNGMLYWSSARGESLGLDWCSTWEDSSNFLIGLDPLMIDDANINPSSSYEGRLIELEVKHRADDPLYNLSKHHYYQLHCLSVRGSLQICALDTSDNSILVWEFKEEKDLITASDGTETLQCSLEEGFWVDMAEEVELLCFNPNGDCLLYVRLEGAVGYRLLKINVRTRVVRMGRVGKVSEGYSPISDYCFFPIEMDPLWPTTVPKQRMTPSKQVKKSLRQLQYQLKTSQGEETIMPASH